MIGNKTLMILAGVLVALIAGVGLLWARDNGKLPVETKSAMGVNWQNIADSLASVRMGNGEQQITLTKSGEHWQIGKYQADDRLTAELIAGIKNMEVGSLVSDNPDNQSVYGVASSSGVPVTLGTSTGQVDLVVGDNAPSGGVYMRKADSNQVYVVTGLDRDDLVRTSDDWRDKTIAMIAADQIKEVKVTRPDGVMDVIRGDDGKWIATMGTKTATLEDNTAQRLSASFGPLSGSGFLSDVESLKFDEAKSKYQVEVMSSSGSSTNLSMEEQGSVWWVKVGGAGEGYKVAGTLVGDFILDPKVVFK